MAQAGIHAILGISIRKVVPHRTWLMLGILLGSLLPDMDNFAVAVATVAKLDTHNLHRTFTHSLLAMFVLFVLFFLIGQVRKQPRWTNLGVGLATGVGLHIALDLLLWFNGVALLWPFGGWVNLWAGFNAPVWFSKLLDPLEFLFFALYFLWLVQAAKRQGTDAGSIKTVSIWMIAMVALFVIFTPLAYLMSKGFLTIFGVVYLVAITAAFIITIRMRQTVETY